jgi:hypothetical protein
MWAAKFRFKFVRSVPSTFAPHFLQVLLTLSRLRASPVRAIGMMLSALPPGPHWAVREIYFFRPYIRRRPRGPRSCAGAAAYRPEAGNHPKVRGRPIRQFRPGGGRPRHPGPGRSGRGPGLARRLGPPLPRELPLRLHLLPPLLPQSRIGRHLLVREGGLRRQDGRPRRMALRGLGDLRGACD